jgi:hypothetical protein
MLLKGSLNDSRWELINEIIRFLCTIDPAELENDVFDFSNESIATVNSSNTATVSNSSESQQQQLKSPNTKSVSSINKALASSPSSIGLPTPNKLKSSPIAIEKSTVSKKRSLSAYDNESSTPSKGVRRSIEEIIYDYAFELLNTYRLKKLFELFANINNLSISKWLQQFEYVFQN